ncbi:MAG: hypothetical protein Q7T82_07210 [Armatimonadota bacterium]|nr:hypothetical protein [Armatimonadota bacterium]
MARWRVPLITASCFLLMSLPVFPVADEVKTAAEVGDSAKSDGGSGTPPASPISELASSASAASDLVRLGEPQRIEGNYDVVVRAAAYQSWLVPAADGSTSKTRGWAVRIDFRNLLSKAERKKTVKTDKGYYIRDAFDYVWVVPPDGVKMVDSLGHTHYPSAYTMEDPKRESGQMVYPLSWSCDPQSLRFLFACSPDVKPTKLLLWDLKPFSLTRSPTVVVAISPSAKAQGQPPSRVSPASPLPPFSGPLDEGTHEVRIRNPNRFAVKTGLRMGGKGKDFDVPARGKTSVFVPNGRYSIYFVYSNKPRALFRGDSFTLGNCGIQIQIVKVVNGNYRIRQVK